MNDLRARYEKAIDAACEHWESSHMTWGVDDCLMAIADIDREVLGVDTGAFWRGGYHDEAGAMALAGSVPRAMRKAAKHFAWKRIDPSDAQAGDRGLIRNIDCRPAGVIFDGQFWAGRLDPGVANVPSSLVRIAWSIG